MMSNIYAALWNNLSRVKNISSMGSSGHGNIHRPAPTPDGMMVF
jgi:hypothetical protein